MSAMGERLPFAESASFIHRIGLKQTAKQEE